ncbi:MAG: 50S ribosomal protein L1 [Anaerolineales bacterium]|nr:50S ribosomal protein L1 [Anaerolineales bacterium]
MSDHGKKYLAAAKQVDPEKLYSPADAVKLAKATSITKFDATVEVHMRLGVDPKQADQQVRDVVVLPHGLGKNIRVLVFTAGESANSAREAGAEHIADSDDMVKKIQDGWADFDVAIATPEMMAKVGKLGRVLGPRGLMPNPKAGTVVPPEDIAKAVKEAKAGRVEFRLDKTANLHVSIGKASFSEKALYENFAALMEAIKRAKPAAVKGIFLRKIVMATTMGPGVHVDPAAAQAMEVG